MRIMICGHDTLVNERLERIISDLGYCACTVQFGVGQPDSCLVKICTRKPEVLIIHALMPDTIRLCQQLQTNTGYTPAIVLIGKEEMGASCAYALGVADFLLSPVAKEDLLASLMKVTKLNAAQAFMLAKKPIDKDKHQARQYIAARTHRGVEMVALADIYYFAADQKYVKVRHKDGMVLIDETLKELEEEFCGSMFRIHRNALVNLDYLDLLESVDSGQYQVRFRGIEEALCVSRRHLPALREKIHNI